MANAFLTPEWIAREALMLLSNNMVAGQLFYRDYETEFTSGFKKGDTVSIRRPTNAVVEEFISGNPTAREVTETQVPIVLERHFDANVAITARQQTLEMEDFSKQVLEPYMLEMAESIDTYALTKLNLLPNQAVYDATAVNVIADVSTLRKQANVQKIPMRDRISIIDTEVEANLLSIDSFVTADKVGDEGTTLREASLGKKMGISWFLDQNVDSSEQTSGDISGGAVTVTGAMTEGDTTIGLSGFNGDTLVTGDIIEIVGSSFTENFTVLVGGTFSGGVLTVTVNEPVRFAQSGGEPVTILQGNDATYFNRGAIFNQRALALVAVPLDLPLSNENAFYVDSGGYGLRIVWSYDQSTKSDNMAIDVLCGAAVIDGRLGYRINSPT